LEAVMSAAVIDIFASISMIINKGKDACSQGLLL